MAEAWIHEPRVTLLAVTQFTPPSHIEWETDTDNPAQRLIEFAGRLCYRSFHNPSGRANAEYIGHLLAQGHLSVIEHASASFLIEGISRSCSHEIVRHRHFSYSQVSQRFVNEAEARMVLPPALEGDPEAQAIAESVTRASKEAYARLVERLRARYAHVDDPSLRRKLARQAARSVLPNATETALVMTGNFRAWRHFVRMRASEHAEAEIRRVAIAVLKILQEQAPAVFGDFTIRRQDDGSEVAEPGYAYE
ncbi:MAG: FAD-dependent thymidylate synthase [Limnochordaceae bacterium]|nr:FAD-dependent thymidylate synthase [Limnochordaceae bacterium]